MPGRRVNKVENIRHNPRGRVIGYDVTVIVSELISARRRRHVAVIRRRHRFQATTVVIGQLFSRTNMAAPVRVLLHLPDIALIVTTELVPVLLAEVIVRLVLMPVVIVGLLVAPVPVITAAILCNGSTRKS